MEKKHAPVFCFIQSEPTAPHPGSDSNPLHSDGKAPRQNYEEAFAFLDLPALLPTCGEHLPAFFLGTYTFRTPVQPD